MCTLARLSFWVPPERMDTFESAYKKKIVPILRKHDLEESSEPGRPTVEGVFSRLFEVETPAQITAKESALWKDPAWQEELRTLGIAFGMTQPDGLLRMSPYPTQVRSGSEKTRICPTASCQLHSPCGHWI